MEDALDEIARSGLAAWERGDALGARLAFEQVAAGNRATPLLWLLLAQARIADGAGGVDEALDRLLGLEPRNPAGLVLKGDRAADERTASGYYGLALQSATDAHFRDPAVGPMLTRAQARQAELAAGYSEHLRAVVADVDAGTRFADALALVTGEKELFLQSPTNFYFPGLPQRQFFEPAEFAWAAALEAAAPAITGELTALLAAGADLQPYVQADPGRVNKGHRLLNDPRWSAFHLLEGGRPVPGNAERCPATMAALANLPQPVIADRSPMALFSVLKAGTHIPPHCGMLNTRLIVHLPLIVPPDCRLRVGNDTRAIEAGKLMIFDDSIEHEAWNDSGETRIILLFEIWRPELTAAERGGLATLFEGIGLYDGGQ